MSVSLVGQPHCLTWEVKGYPEGFVADLYRVARGGENVKGFLKHANASYDLMVGNVSDGNFIAGEGDWARLVSYFGETSEFEILLRKAEIELLAAALRFYWVEDEPSMVDMVFISQAKAKEPCRA